MKITNLKDSAKSITWATEIASKGGTQWRIVPTEYGFVTVAVWIDSKKQERDITELRFIYAGVLHTRIIYGKAYRYVVTLARRYAASIVSPPVLLINGEPATTGQDGPKQA